MIDLAQPAHDEDGPYEGDDELVVLGWAMTVVSSMIAGFCIWYALRWAGVL